MKYREKLMAKEKKKRAKEDTNEGTFIIITRFNRKQIIKFSVIFWETEIMNALKNKSKVLLSKKNMI